MLTYSSTPCCIRADAVCSAATHFATFLRTVFVRKPARACGAAAGPRPSRSGCRSQQHLIATLQATTQAPAAMADEGEVSGESESCIRFGRQQPAAQSCSLCPIRLGEARPSYTSSVNARSAEPAVTRQPGSGCLYWSSCCRLRGYAGTSWGARQTVIC